jgi:uncharacterized protein YjbI with pentapeptide repeats
VDEKTEAARPKGLEEAPADSRLLASIEETERPIWRLEELRDADLRDQDLTKIKGLLPEHLAGADLTGAKLPEDIAKFPALDQVAAISSEARKIFIGLLAACVYSWLVIGTTTDVALILNTASSPLPIINTPMPIAGFYVVGGMLLAAIYCYLQFYLQRLWRTLATLPAIFPDGTALDDKSDPWPLTGLARAYVPCLSRTAADPLRPFENVVTIALVWALVPVTFVALWWRYLPCHGWKGTAFLVLLSGISTLYGGHMFRLARVTLRGCKTDSSHDHDPQAASGNVIKEVFALRPDKTSFWLFCLVAVLASCSLIAFRTDPRADWLGQFLNAVYIRTYADLREVEVAQKPEAWTYEEWDEVERVDLRNANLAFADATGAFLANADLRGANLQGAVLARSELGGADLMGANLREADLHRARLRQVVFLKASLEGANLQKADLQGSALTLADLRNATSWKPIWWVLYCKKPSCKAPSSPMRT